MQKQTQTIKEILLQTSCFLKENKIDSPRITSELLLCKTLGLTREKLYMDYDKPLTQSQLSKLESYIKRKADGEPAQYIIGHKEFYSLDFKVTPDVLIPRADTETLVETVVDDIKSSGAKSVKILEMGTGSGAISVAVAHELRHIPALYIKAVDISNKALEIAKENAAKNSVSDVIEFVKSDMFCEIDIEEKYDLILSNPPYISKEFYDILEAGVKDFEPKLALYGGVDGLVFYKEIFKAGYSRLNNGGRIFVEIDFRKKDELKKLVNKNKFSDIIFHKDLSGHDRVMELRKRA